MASVNSIQGWYMGLICILSHYSVIIMSATNIILTPFVYLKKIAIQNQQNEHCSLGQRF